MLTSIHFDDETYSDEIKRRLMKSLPVADVALLRLTVSGLAKVAIFTTNVHTKNECLINHKTVFGTRNPAFWVGAVIASGFCRPSLQTIVNATFHCLCRVGLCGCVFFIFRRGGDFF